MFRRPNEKLRVSGFCEDTGTFSSDSILKKPYIRSSKCGFSLIELLVVIAVIAIIAAIAIPNIANIINSATGSKNLRNAQSIVVSFNAARAAGFNAFIPNPANAIELVALGTNSITGTGSATNGNGMTLGMTVGGLGMSTNNISTASALITSSGAGTNMTLIYTGATN